MKGKRVESEGGRGWRDVKTNFFFVLDIEALFCTQIRFLLFIFSFFPPLFS